MSRIAFLSDLHFPTHHKQAFNLTLLILPHLNLDSIILGGDIVDNEPLTRFQIPPDRRLQLQHTFDVGHKELIRLREAVPNVDIRYKRGNHEAFLDRFLYNKAPELFGLDKITIRGFLELDQLDIEWLRPEKILREGKLLFLHGDEIKVGSVNYARNMYNKVNCNVIFGHYHAESKYIHTLSGSMKNEGAWGNSCLRTLRPDWSPFSHWTLGFSVIDFSSTGFFHVEQVLYLKREGKLWTMVGGKEYSM